MAIIQMYDITDKRLALTNAIPYLYFILYTKITLAKIKVTTLATATGKLPLRKPYIIHKNVPAVKRAYMEREMPDVSFVCMVLIACGKKETVVAKAAK